MSPIAEKLNSRRGASFLLALLFFLICALTASTVLMAAASGAGRTRGGLEEHQRYLALSSAVRTLCDELTACQYQGRYHYRVELHYGEDEEGNQIVTGSTSYLTRQTGLYRYQAGNGEAGLSGLLRPVFDSIFALEFTNGLADVVNRGNDVFVADVTRALTVTPSSGEAALDGEPVTVSLTVRQSYEMVLVARMGDYAVQAQLTPDANPPKPSVGSQGIHDTLPMRWRLSAILPGDTWGEGADAGG